MLNLMAVLPVPKTSYATPRRGVMSLKAFTPSVRGNVMGAALKREATVVPLPSAGLKLHARSYRRAPCSVRRLRVHVSSTNADAVPVRSEACHIGSRYVNWFATRFRKRYASSESLVTTSVFEIE